MPVFVDFTVSADDLTWLGQDDLTSITATQWRTPDHFYEDTLVVFINGLRVEKDNDDGYNIIDDETFEMKETYPTRFRISCGYVKKEV